MQKTNTLTVMVNSKNYDITVQDSFTIWLSVQMHHDFKTHNISRKELLRAYVSKVHELYLLEQKLDGVIESFPQS